MTHDSVKVFNSRQPIYSLDWSGHSSHFCSLAVGSFVTESPGAESFSDGGCNSVQFPSLTDPHATEFSLATPTISLQFPSTKTMFSPNRSGEPGDLLGVSGDGLRIYRVTEGTHQAELLTKLVPAQISTSPTDSSAASRRPSDANIITGHQSSGSGNRVGGATVPRNSPAPITSFDWNRVDPHLLVTSSYDTTCAVWNLNTASVKTQLIAHDKEVFDVAFNPKSADIFASVGAEGSIRLFDTRFLDHSTILYETADAQPLLRLAWNPLDNNYVACFGVDAQQIVIVDVRSAAVPVAVLGGHTNVTAMRWAPHNSGWLMAADGDAIKLWDVSQNVQQPGWFYSAGSVIQNLAWPVSAPDWLAISTAMQVQLIKL